MKRKKKWAVEGQIKRKEDTSFSIYSLLLLYKRFASRGGSKFFRSGFESDTSLDK